MKKATFIGFIEAMLDKYNMSWLDFTLEPDEFEKKLIDEKLNSSNRSVKEK